MISNDNNIDVEEEFRKTILKQTDTLLLSDIFALSAKEVYLVEYISQEKIICKDFHTKKPIEFRPDDFKDKSIHLLHRNVKEGFARQNGFIEDRLIILIFDTDEIRKGKIVKLENDSILVETLTEGLFFYDFEYKGFIPRNGLLKIELDEEIEEEDVELDNDEEEEEQDQDDDDNISKLIMKKETNLFSGGEKSQKFYNQLLMQHVNYDPERNTILSFDRRLRNNSNNMKADVLYVDDLFSVREEKEIRSRIQSNIECFLYDFGVKPKTQLENKLEKPLKVQYLRYRNSILQTPLQSLHADFEIKQYFLNEAVFPNITLSELLKHCIVIDFARTYISFLSLAVRPSITEYISSTLNNLKKDKKRKKNMIIAKEYTNLSDIAADNNKIIFFDEKYDKLKIDINPVIVASPTNIHRNEEDKIPSFKREVQDGHFALLVDEKGTNFFHRVNGQWEVFHAPINLNDFIYSNSDTIDTKTIFDEMTKEINSTYDFEEKSTKNEYDFLVKLLPIRVAQYYFTKKIHDFKTKPEAAATITTTFDDISANSHHRRMYFIYPESTTLPQQECILPQAPFYSTVSFPGKEIKWKTLIGDVLFGDLLKKEQQSNDIIHLLSRYFIYVQTSDLTHQIYFDDREQIFDGYPVFTNNPNNNKGLRTFVTLFVDAYVKNRTSYPWKLLPVELKVTDNKSILIDQIIQKISFHCKYTLYWTPFFHIRRLMYLKKKRAKKEGLESTKRTFLKFEFTDHVDIELLKLRLSAETDKSLIASIFKNIHRSLDTLLVWKQKEPESIVTPPQSSYNANEETIYRCFFKYGMFSTITPLSKIVGDICNMKFADIYNISNNDEDMEDVETYKSRTSIIFKPDSTIEEKIIVMKDHGKAYTDDNLKQLMQYLSFKQMTFVSFPTSNLRMQLLREFIDKTLSEYVGDNKLLTFMKQLLSDENKSTSFCKYLAMTNEKLMETELPKHFHEIYLKTFTLTIEDINEELLNLHEGFQFIAKTIKCLIENKIRFDEYFDNKKIIDALTTVQINSEYILGLSKNTPYINESSPLDLKMVTELFKHYFLLIISQYNETRVLKVDDYLKLFFEEYTDEIADTTNTTTTTTKQVPESLEMISEERKEYLLKNEKHLYIVID